MRVPACAVALISCCAGTQLSAGQGFLAKEVAAEANANTRYVVESVTISGENGLKLTRSLQTAFAQLIGSHFDPSKLDDLAREMRKELHLKSVTPHLSRGTEPDRVRVDFEAHRKSIVFDVTLPKFLYHSKEGWSAEGTASTTIARYNRFTFGLVSDGDALTERFAGSSATYENTHVGTDRVHLSFEFDDLHEQWNRATLMALDSNPKDPQVYRSRRIFQPSVTVLLARYVTFQGGASFEQLEMQPASLLSATPLPVSAIPSSTNNDSANALFAIIRFHRVFEGTAETQEIAADYDLRSASSALHSDYTYTRHQWGLTYRNTRGRQTLQDDFTAGYISGNAPFFDRFVVGTSSLLRGWNRFEIDPLGGTRLVHNSVTYRYRFPKAAGEVFYDAGSLWHGSGDSGVRHSLGAGVTRSIFTLAVAFPVREGRSDPVFMVGMNY